MPVYVCPICKRTVEKPESVYYCRVCGPEAIMVKVGKKLLPIGEERRDEKLEEFLRKLFIAEGYPETRVEKRTEKAYDVILFYETSHPSWVYIRFLNEYVDVHFSYAISTPYISEDELKRIFGFKPKEYYSGYVYVRLKSPILIWANVWSDEIHVHHRSFVKDYELKTYLPIAIREMKRVVRLLKRNPLEMLVGRPRIYTHPDPY